jgi:hypothetical protein
MVDKSQVHYLGAGEWRIDAFSVVRAMMAHVKEKHDDTAKATAKMHTEDPKKWVRETKSK